MRVFYCLWADRCIDQVFGTTMLTYHNRLAPVLAGRRNLGQRSLEIAAWCHDTDQEAEAALLRQLQKIIRVPNLTADR